MTKLVTCPYCKENTEPVQLSIISETYMTKMFGINGWIRFWKKLPNLKILIIWWMPSLMTIQKRNSKLEN